MSNTEPNDDRSLANDWLARFLSDHPKGDKEAFETWATGQSELAADDSMRELVRAALEDWRRSVAVLGVDAADESSMSYFGGQVDPASSRTPTVTQLRCRPASASGASS